MRVPPRKLLTPALVVAIVVAFVLFAYGLEALEKNCMAPLPGAALEKGDLPKASEKAIDLYVEIAKSLLSYAIAAVGGLAYLLQRDLEKEKPFSAAQGAILGSSFLVLIVSVFFGISGIQYIADNLARQIAFATPATAGLPLEQRFRHILQVQYYSFMFALALIALEVLRRLSTTTPSPKETT